jgi:hypothetical protein
LHWRLTETAVLAAAAILLGGCVAASSQTPTTEAVSLTTTLDPGSVGSGSPDSIAGYGDYSDYKYEDLRGDEIEALVIQCLLDQGFPVVAIDGGGISYENVPPEQNHNAELAFDACMAGLDLPPPEPPSAEFIEDLYTRLVDVEACLEDLGYEIEDPPSLQAFIDSYETGPWHPYLSLPLDAPHAELERACPVEAH